MKTKNCAPIFSLGGPEMVWQKKTPVENKLSSQRKIFLSRVFSSVHMELPRKCCFKFLFTWFHSWIPWEMFVTGEKKNIQIELKNVFTPKKFWQWLRDWFRTSLGAVPPLFNLHKKKTHAAASTRHSGVWSTCSQSRAILKISPKQRRTAGLKQRDSEESHTEM